MVQPRLDADASRSTYWREGALIGAAVGVVAAIVLIDTATMCTTGVPAQCDTSYAPRIMGGFLFGVAGAFVGGMFGASLPRAPDHGG